MKSFCCTITDNQGIHARPACQLAKLAGSFSGTIITIILGQKRADATQVMEVMGLNVKKDDVVTIEISGMQEEICLKAMSDFFEGSFS